MVIRNRIEGVKAASARKEAQALAERRASHFPIHDTATLKFLQTMRHMDRSGTTHRDVIILYVIIQQPGVCGQDIAEKINVRTRSNVAKGIQRLTALGFVEDRRTEIGTAKPQILHALQPGIEFFNSLKFWQEGNAPKLDDFWSRFND